MNKDVCKTRILTGKRYMNWRVQCLESSQVVNDDKIRQEDGDRACDTER